MIAIRPPGGTPDGGPFRFDFLIKNDPTIIKPGDPFPIEDTKAIEENIYTKLPELIPDKWFTKDWYAFMTCQTKEDGCWHDDHNKYWFELKEAKPKQ